jgi:hypothetical protein
MTKLFVATVSAAALLLAASAASAAEPNGYVGASYADTNDADAHAWGVEGAAVFPVGPVQVQVDAAGSQTKVKGFSNDKAFVGTGHVFYRNDNWAAGAFVSGADEGFYAWGGEGALYLDRVTLSAAAGQLRDESEGGVGNLGTAIGVGGKVFVTDNFSLGANYTSLDPKGPGGTLDFWGLAGEYRFDKAPVSVSLGYQRNDDLDVDAWSIGARWHFGTGSLKEQDRKGASMGAGSILSLF